MILANFRILAFQNPEFKISSDLKILVFQNLQFNILASQSADFKILADVKILDFENLELKILGDCKIIAF